MKKRISALAMALGFVAAVSPMAASAATTGTTNTTVGITPGALSVTAPGVSSAFTSVSLNGDVQTTKATLGSMTVGDSTGYANGYRVTVSASRFTDGGTLNLPLNTMVMKAPSAVTAATTTQSAAPVPKSDGPWAIDNGGSAVTILSAAAGTGMGIYNVAMPADTLTMTLKPESTKTDSTKANTTYSSVLTFTVVTGP